jgi:hypothetical protein
MLYENGCGHVEGLQTIMSSCDASILEYLPEEIEKQRSPCEEMVGRTCPMLQSVFTPEVRIFSTCCGVFKLC